MRLLPLVFLPAVFVATASAKEITITSKDGREMTVTVIHVFSDSVEFRRADKKEYTLPFAKLNDDSVAMLKKTVEEEAALAAKQPKEERIPKFPHNPKSLDQLPQKIVIRINEGETEAREHHFTFNQVKTFFVDPKESLNPAKTDPVLTISLTFGGDTARAGIAHNLRKGDLSFKMIFRTAKGDELPNPEQFKLSPRSSYGGPGKVSFGIFSTPLEEDIRQIILYDFQAAE